VAELAPSTKASSTKATKAQAPHIWRYALWPVSVWLSFRQFEHHAADDYVELTSPIMAAAVCFWLCVGWIAGIFVFNGTLGNLQALAWITPVVYLIGLALYVNRERHFSKSLDD
jgi:hypothetical protein